MEEKMAKGKGFDPFVDTQGLSEHNINP